MPCVRHDVPGGFAIVCTRGARAKPVPCYVCGAPSSRLCDHLLSEQGKTCDRPCCEAHSLRIGRNFDLCQACATAAGRWPATTTARLRVRSASLAYRGPGALPVALDVCERALGEGRPAPGLALAPTRKLLNPAIAARRRAEAMLAGAGGDAEACARALRVEAQAWAHYRPLYLAGMLISAARPVPPGWERRVAEAWELGFRPAPEAWWALPGLAQGGDVVFTCFCAGRWRALGHCHTRLLCEIVARLGGEDMGEVGAT